MNEEGQGQGIVKEVWTQRSPNVLPCLNHLFPAPSFFTSLLGLAGVIGAPDHLAVDSTYSPTCTHHVVYFQYLISCINTNSRNNKICNVAVELACGTRLYITIKYSTETI